MEIHSSYKGKTIREAYVVGATVEHDAEELLQMVLDHFKETKGRLFGWSVEFFADGQGAKVTLMTD